MTDRPILNGLNSLLIGALLLVTLAGFFTVPLDASLPIHWGLDGQPDNFAPAPLALLLPLLLAAALVGTILLLRSRQDFAAGRHVIQAATSVILAIALVLGGATIAIGLGYGVNMPRMVSVLVAIMLLVLGNYLPKSQPNGLAGIRLPWTWRDAGNWRVTHRWAGRLMMLGGAIALVAAILNPPPAILLGVVLASVLLPILASIAISYALARR